ncbi:DEAD/DEAH box helicase [Miniimonas arenae]|uniref:DEAD/DEAH box helicase n=1 Tax=Miniimonas arenae TaxID=676201 RepID=UPI001FE53142|nr:DEAD/DEAH box helicase [Miniimonas arenae]
MTAGSVVNDVPRGGAPSALDALLTTPARRASLLHVAELPPREGERALWPDWAPSRLVEAYRASGVSAPWRHQVEAAQAVHDGAHTVLATSTGSGKSLAAWLPALTAVLAAPAPTGSVASIRRRASVLYLSPTKALAADQASALHALLAAGGLDRDVRVTTCDGDTPPNERDWARAHADVVLSNPDFLHFTLLPGHERWSRFLRGLTHVVLDECHAYRGVLGAHVALVLRRLLRIAAHLGATPVVVAASATAGEPGETLARLIGVRAEDVVAVTRSTAPQGRRHVALWEPPPVDAPDGEDWALEAPGGTPANDGYPASPGWASSPGSPSDAAWARGGDPSDRTTDDAPPGPHPVDARSSPREPTRSGEPTPSSAPTPSGAPQDVVRRSALRETTDLLADLVLADRRTLAFVRSRAGVESVATETARTLARRTGGGLDALSSLAADDVVDPVPTLEAGGSVAVAAYRGGYLPEERRVLERALREGRLGALATTNALELGIDVSGLDAVLMAGWPGTRVSFWQQTGRAGRAGADGVAVLVAGANPLDTYLVHHPEAIFDEAVEATTFDPCNPYVLAPHLCAAAAELPLTASDVDLFGLSDDALLVELGQRGLLRRRPGGWYWNFARPESPSRLTDLRGGGAPGVAVVETATGTVLGTVDGGRSDAVVHPGAVYVHQGRTYVVDELTEDAALVHAEVAAHRTAAHAAHHATLLDVRSRAVWGPVTWAYGPVEVTSQVQSYDVRRPPSMAVIGTVPLEMPVRTLPTTGVWWSCPTDVLTAETGIAPGEVPGALHAAEHAAIGVLPLLATCDRWDIGGVSTALHPDTGAPTVIVHDGYPGGAGFAERGFRAAQRWIEATYEAVASCGCHRGCPRCVFSPKCGNGNHPLDKGAALRVLAFLRAVAPSS